MNSLSSESNTARLRRAALGGIVVFSIITVIPAADELHVSDTGPQSSVPLVTPSAAPTMVAAAPSLAPVKVTQPPVIPTESTAPAVVKQSAIPNLKLEVQARTTYFTYPAIGFNEPLVPLEIAYDDHGQPLLPDDVRAYLVTNLTPRNCDVSGGDFIMGHTSVYTDYWGKVPFNAFKSLTSASHGQVFTIGSHRYEVVKIIVQPKAALTTTKEFWCQPSGNVSIVSCYTQEEGGDNIIVIGRPTP